MSSSDLCTLLLGVALTVLPAPLRAADASGADPSAALGPQRDGVDSAAVTASTLLASERFWPYQVALRSPWRATGSEQALAPGAEGVLIRVEDSGLARIDFGRDGVHAIPAGETDLLERSNRIRRGELEKPAPNFVFALGPRLLDSAIPGESRFSYREVIGYTGFLCVFADPMASGFAELAKALAPLRERRGLLTIVFPQGGHSDARVGERLRALGWKVPFVHAHLAEGYTRSLLDETLPAPALILQTAEGRVLFADRFGSEVASRVRAAWERVPADAAPPGSTDLSRR